MDLNLGFELSGVNLSRFGIQRGTTLRAGAATEMATVQVPGRSGAIITSSQPVYSPGQWVGNFRVRPREAQPGTDQGQAEMDALIDGLSRLAYKPGQNLVRVLPALDYDGGTRRQAAAVTAQSVTFGEYLAGFYQDVTVTLAMPGVFFRDENPVTTDIDGGYAGGLAGGSGPIFDPIIRLYGPFERATVTGQGGTGVSWTGAVTAGRVLAIDVATLSATINGTPAGHVDYPPAGPLELWPTGPNGSIPITVSLSGASTSTRRPSITARRSYL